MKDESFALILAKLFAEGLASTAGILGGLIVVGAVISKVKKIDSKETK